MVKTTTMRFDAEEIDLLRDFVDYVLLAVEPIGNVEHDREEYQRRLNVTHRLERRFEQAAGRLYGPDPEEMELMYGNSEGDHPELDGAEEWAT